MHIRPFLLLSYLPLSRVSSMVTPKIKNFEYNSCRNCKHLIPDSYGSVSSINTNCKMFGKKDIITDEINFDYTDDCRNNESKCGIQGKYFEEEENLFVKIVVSRVKSFSSSYSIIFIPIITYVLLQIINNQ